MDIPEQGDYSSDVFQLGGVKITNQTFAYTKASAEPYGNFGLSPPNTEVGFREGRFPQYPTFMEQLALQGVYDNACFSVWLDPHFPGEGFTTMPHGQVTFGGIDTGKFIGELITFPVSSKINNSAKAARWDLSLTSITHGHNKTNLSPKPIDCFVSLAGGSHTLPQDVYDNLAAAIPHSSFNQSIGLYEVPCDAKYNPNNKITLTFASPETINHPKGNHFSLEIPVEGFIWPMTAMLGADGDPNTCTIAAQPMPEGSTRCDLGWVMTKRGYWVYDLFNGEISYAPAAARGQKTSRTIRIPKEGVAALDLSC